MPPGFFNCNSDDDGNHHGEADEPNRRALPPRPLTMLNRISHFDLQLKTSFDFERRHHWQFDPIEDEREPDCGHEYGRNGVPRQRHHHYA